MMKRIFVLAAAFLCLALNLRLASAETTAVYLDRDEAAGRISSGGAFYDETNPKDPEYIRRIRQKVRQTKANAMNIAVVVTGDNEILVTQNVRKAVNDMMEVKFPWTHYNVKHDPRVYTRLYEILEEEIPQREVEKDNPQYRQYGYNFGIGSYHKHPIDLNNLSKEQLLEAGRKSRADYLIVLSLYANKEKARSSFWVNRNESLIVLRARCLDLSSGKYLYFRDVLEAGQSSSFFGFGGKYAKGRARARAATSCLMAFFADLPIGEKVSRRKLEELWHRQQFEKEMQELWNQE